MIIFSVIVNISNTSEYLLIKSGLVRTRTHVFIDRIERLEVEKVGSE